MDTEFDEFLYTVASMDFLRAINHDGIEINRCAYDAWVLSVRERAH